MEKINNSVKLKYPTLQELEQREKEVNKQLSTILEQKDKLIKSIDKLLAEQRLLKDSKKFIKGEISGVDHPQTGNLNPKGFNETFLKTIIENSIISGDSKK